LGVADMLDLDAEVFASALEEITGWARRHAGAAPRVIADVGAGTGTGTLALARRFPEADLVAVDRSPLMLARLGAAARADGVTDRLRLVEADLDVAWPAIDAVDVVWAASSLHHAEDPDRLMRDIHRALRPGGLLVVTEMDGMPRFLPEDLGIGRPGLEARCRAAMARESWNAYPNWSAPLARAGFEIAEERVFDVRLDPAPPAANAYAFRVLRGMRSRLADRLDADDIDILDRLLTEHAAGSVLCRRDLAVRTTRTAWAARRP
jgi:SAM-dependent methyltransferase